MQVLDLRGQSGTSYRFRRVLNPLELQAHSGNFVVLRVGHPTHRLEACGTRRSLAELAGDWRALTAGQATIFVRLNVSRAVRIAEHEDLVAGQAPSQDLQEPD